MDMEALAQELFACMTVLRRGPIDKARAFSKGEKSILACLAFEHDSATPTELSRLFHISTARVANALNSLEKKGCIERVRSGEDRRKVYVHITDQGRRAVSCGRDSAISDLQALLTDLGEEDAETYVRITKRILALVQAKEAQLSAEPLDGVSRDAELTRCSR